MKKFIEYAVKEGISVIEKLLAKESIEFMNSVALSLANSYKKGGKVIIAGNGGSLCDAMHFAEELTGQFRKRRKALPAIALADAAHITCVGNDFGFDEIFSRGVEAYGKPEDIFVGLTTSGKSPNIVRAFEKAKELGLTTVAFLGKSGGVLKGVADYELLIDGFSTSDRIQEAHMTAIHIIIEIAEKHLFEKVLVHENQEVCC